MPTSEHQNLLLKIEKWKNSPRARHIRGAKADFRRGRVTPLNAKGKSSKFAHKLGPLQMFPEQRK